MCTRGMEDGVTARAEGCLIVASTPDAVHLEDRRRSSPGATAAPQDAKKGLHGAHVRWVSFHVPSPSGGHEERENVSLCLFSCEMSAIAVMEELRTKSGFGIVPFLILRKKHDFLKPSKNMIASGLIVLW
eukprot:CAMPEP_0116832238 /NCGR_PEP_ID=MMETSP0418-20121206/5782_1 /TAXON_ID=1158023 /ORGANISM="Astrosyne radiata, Strain 13vi08-1A" /LENGTH=129 /DNA_ID=CAMNT_0004461579 /DNA_START=2634 /DNA_END=3021 /DNA_ORIENTATION=+